MRYTAARYFEIVDPDSVAAVLEEAGAEVLTPELSRLTTVRQYRVGASCDDLPEGNLSHLLATGHVVDLAAGDEDDGPVGWPEGLSNGAIAALDREGIGPEDVGEMSDAELLDVNGIGRASVDVLRGAFPERIDDPDTGDESDDPDTEDDE